MTTIRCMGSPSKTLDAVLSGRRDQNVRFEDLRRVVLALGFDERIKGDHFIYTRQGLPEIINLQPLRNGSAKAYQVKQVRGIVTRYRLGLET